MDWTIVHNEVHKLLSNEKVAKSNKLWALIYCVIKFPEMGCLIRYRLKGEKFFGVKLLRLLLALYSKSHNLYFRLPANCIGEGCLVVHGFSTIINCKKIGRSFTIYQQVTIAQTKKGRATIGDNVTIYPGAKVIGNVIIGDNVIVGANAVVNENIPANCIVAGVPAKIIKRLNPITGVWEKENK